MAELTRPKRPYQVCTRCVMDTSARDIHFDDRGVCNYCTDYLTRSEGAIGNDPDLKKQKLDTFIAQVKQAGKNKRYDCIVGVSGGVDSSWVLVQSVKMGLRPLAVHMDNGWNSELAQHNIANLVRRLNADLHTHVIAWPEYRALMQAFFDADVIDVELLYDNALHGVNYRLAAKYGVKFILSGNNQATEGMRMPADWNWFKYDKKNIAALGQKFGHVHIETFPAFSTQHFIWYSILRRIRWTSILDLMDYNKYAAMDTMQRDYGFKPYPYKHYESVFTRFYQAYLLPEKFGVDKRRLHLSTLVISGQIERDEALSDLQGLPYSTPEDLHEDRQYFLKKMGWNEAQLKDYISRPPVAHDHYPSERALFKKMAAVYQGLFKAS